MDIELIVTQSLSEPLLDNIDYTKTKTFKEANSVVNGCIDYSTYSIIKALERNQNFIKEVQAIREEFGVPANHTLSTWVNFQDLREKAKKNNTFKDFSEYVFRIRHVSEQKLGERFNIPMILHYSLGFIVLGSFIWLPLTKIDLVSSAVLSPIYGGEEVSILLLSKVSKNELKKYIDKNFALIEKEMSRIFKKDLLFTISERDLEIFDMRTNENKSFNEIADLLAESTQDYNINEDSVKTAYHTTKNKIESLTKKGK